MFKILFVLSALFALSHGLSEFPATWLSDNTPIIGENFGTSVAVSGTLVVVGAPYWGPGNNQQGAAFVYNCPSSTTCSPVTTLNAPDWAAGDAFGFSVAIDGNTVVVGAPFKTVNGNIFEGSAYVFTCTSSSCDGGQAITQPAAGAPYDDFGTAVAVSGNMVVVGCDQKTENSLVGQGVVYVFTCSSDTCTPYSTISCPNCLNGGENFGKSVAISGTLVAVGAPFTTIGPNNQQGEGFVFDCSTSDCAIASSALASDGADSDNFGFSVSISAGVAVFGAPSANASNNDWQGAAYVFTCTTSSCTEQSKLLPSDGQAFENFGYATAISGTKVIVGAWTRNQGNGIGVGNGYYFDCANVGSCSQSLELLSQSFSGNDGIGFAVAASNVLAVLGSPGWSSSTTSGAGRVGLFNLPSVTYCAAYTANYASYPATAVGAIGYGACASGYYGHPTRTCLSTETFGPESNSCQPDVANCAASTYAYYYWPQTNPGSSATGSCIPGFSGPSASRYCYAYGWSTLVTGGVCTQNHCTAASAGTAGNATWATTTSGSTAVSVTGTCINGCFGTATRTCNPDGTWGTPTSSCTSGGNCPAVNNVGFSNWPSTPAGTVASGTCQTGWGEANGQPSTRLCNSDGTWNAAVHNFCVRIYCPAYTTGDTTFPQTISMAEQIGTCINGGKGAPRAYCSATGTWENFTGLCS